MSPRRRIDGWGYEGESFAPPAPLLAWLERRLGSGRPSPPHGLTGLRLPAPRALPPLPAISTAGEDRIAHARGQGLPDLLRLRAAALPALPDAVARPRDDAEVEGVLHAAAAAGVRVIPWGGGTSVTGGVNTLAGAAPVVVLDTERLAGLEALDAESGHATFGAGTRGPGVEAALAAGGHTLGHLPQSWELSTLGGWITTRSSGQESLGYGGIEDLVAGLELVAPAGRLTLPALPASAAGPDLRQLVLGSEGRLGVVTRATVRLSPAPAGRTVRAWLLPAWREGVAAARDLLRDRVPLSLLRLSDEPETEVALAVGLAGRAAAGAVRRYLGWRGVAQGCLLLAGAVGRPGDRRPALRQAGAVVRRHGGVSLGSAPGRHWLADRFRHPYLRDGLLDRGVATDTLETAAPWGRLPALYRQVGQAIGSALASEGEAVAVLCHLSHPYPDGGSLYFTCFFRLASGLDDSLARWARLKRAATTAIVAAGGTLSHHHGVGSWHAPWYPSEVGASGLAVVAAAAATLDPGGILNSHVLLDPVDRLLA